MTNQELKQARTSKSLTQQELAERAGWTGKNAFQRVYDYESGRRKMSPAVATLFKMILAE